MPLHVGPSWVLALPAVAAALLIGIGGDSGTPTARTAVAVAGAIAVFASVLAHEAGHVLAARRRGVPVRRVVVSLVGGYSEMTLDDPGDEVVVSLAGPFVSGALAGGFLTLSALLPATAGMPRVASLLALVNVGVAGGNLLPVLPLDGGRVVRGVVRARGVAGAAVRRSVAAVGMAFGLALIALGSVAAGVGAGILLIGAIPVGMLVIAMAVAARQ